MANNPNQKWKIISIGLTVGLILGAWLFTRDIRFDPARWAENPSSWNGSARFRMRNSVIRKLEEKPTGEKILSVLGVPDRGALDQGYIAYRLGRHRKVFSVSGDLYWLSINIKDGVVTSAKYHPD